MKNIKAILIILIIGLLALNGCAPTRQGERPTPAPEPVESIEAPRAETRVDADARRAGSEPSRREIVDRLSNFHARILTEPDEPCPGPDGKHMIHLGRSHRLQIVLEFLEDAPSGVASDHLVARIRSLDKSFPFIKRMSGNEFATARTSLDFLDSDLNIGPSDVLVYYRDREGETLLGEMGRVVVDTAAPPRPVNIKVMKSGADFFEATWELDRAPDAGEIKEIIVKKRDAGAWRSVWSGPSTPPVRVSSPPAGQFRIVAVDCALNRIWTDFTPDAISVARSGCGGSRNSAYKKAVQRVKEGIYEEYIEPRLKRRTGLTTREWIPPEISYTPSSQARFHKKDGKWCAEVVGYLNRERFNRWIENLTRKLENRKRKGVRLHTRGKGADILASLFKAEAANQGLVIHDEDEVIDFKPSGRLTINVSLGPPSPLSHTMADIYCWHVNATVNFTSQSGQRIYLTQANMDDLDARIYGATLRDALYNQGPNSFTERIGRPFVKAFFQKFTP